MQDHDEESHRPGTAEGEAAEKPVIEANLTYSLRIGAATPTEGEGKGQITKEQLLILPKFSAPLPFPLRGILSHDAKDYRITIALPDGQLALWGLGLSFEDFIRNLVGQRNQLILKDMLMEEKLNKPVARGAFAFSTQSGDAAQAGDCELRLYETALVIMPDRSDLIRIPYSDIESAVPENYRLTISTEYGERVTLSQFGRLFDPFTKGLSEANAELQKKVLDTLKGLLPSADAAQLRTLAGLMKEGRAAGRSAIEAVSPSAWAQLEKEIAAVGISREYEFLRDLTRGDQAWIGVKRGLMGDMTGQYIWFLIPIIGKDPAAPGNAIAMEASSKEGTSRATYFFRIARRKEYRAKSADELGQDCERLIKTINRALIEINFRREPIYLPEEKLLEPAYQRYLFSISRLPSLRTLRSLFIGRVAHSTPEQWERDVVSLLTFNTTSGDDAEKWSKAQ
jgi:hypothetical protein